MVVPIPSQKMRSMVDLHGETGMTALYLTIIPAVVMCIGCIAVQFFSPGPKLSSSFQHFSAGILLAAISSELMPRIKDVSQSLTPHTTIVMFTVGFALGFVCLILLGQLCDWIAPEEDEDALNRTLGSGERGSVDSFTKKTGAQLPSVKSRPRLDKSITATDLEKSGEGYGSIQNKATPKNTSKEGISKGYLIPWALLAVVAVDAILDGVLIGMSVSAGERMGQMMSVALSLEMFFLGISTSNSLVKRGVPFRVALFICTIIPSFIVVGGILGFTVCASFEPPGFLACLSFGVASLIYLICDELLIEAHEDLDNDTWYVTSSLFVGFLLSTVFAILYG